MRKLFVFSVILIVVAYFVLAGRNLTYVQVPCYHESQVQLLGEKTSAVWESDPTYRKARYMQLQKMRLMAPATGIRLSEGEPIHTGRLLTAADWERIITDRLAANPGGLKAEAVLDLEDVFALEAKQYRVRDPLPDIIVDGKPLDAPTVAAGVPLNQKVIGALIQGKVKQVAVVGQGETVGVQPGSLLMVMLIFLALTAALTDLMWNPLIKIIDERRQEIEAGKLLSRNNREEEEKIATDARSLRQEARRAYLKELSEAQSEALKEADSILNAAKAEAHQLRVEANKSLEKSISEAAVELEKQTEQLARQIADELLRSTTKG